MAKHEIDLDHVSELVDEAEEALQAAVAAYKKIEEVVASDRAWKGRINGYATSYLEDFLEGTCPGSISDLREDIETHGLGHYLKVALFVARKGPAP